MTTSVDRVGLEELEGRLEAALRSLAEVYVPATGLASDRSDGARLSLDDTIPTSGAAVIAVGDDGLESTADVLMTRRSTASHGSRRLAMAALAVAAMLLGLIVISGRDTGEVAPGSDSPATDTGPPGWYNLIAPSLPERFPYVALTYASETQLFFVAINAIEGKTLDIHLANGFLSQEPTTVDATGTWLDIPRGVAVGTPAGLVVEIECGIGLGGRFGRYYSGTTNYCDFNAGITSFTKDEIRAVANSLATSLTVSIFDQDLGKPSRDTIDVAGATALIADAFPGQQIDASDTGYSADHIYIVGTGAGDVARTGTVAPLGAGSPTTGDSVRILHGVLPSATGNAEPVTDLYDDSAVVSVFGSGGLYVRISTTDSSPESVTRLAQLARDLVNLDPTTGSTGSPTINTVQATTTTVDITSGATTPAGNTTTTIEPCVQTDGAALAVVVNASHVAGAATWWRASLLASNLPGVVFADPAVDPVVEVVAIAPRSRVLALDGFECPANWVSQFSTGAAVEPATSETLRALVTNPLPAGTSIVLVIGDDLLATAATYATPTTSSVVP
jgi:hypothetical protein